MNIQLPNMTQMAQQEAAQRQMHMQKVDAFMLATTSRIYAQLVVQAIALGGQITDDSLAQMASNAQQAANVLGVHFKFIAKEPAHD